MEEAIVLTAYSAESDSSFSLKFSEVRLQQWTDSLKDGFTNLLPLDSVF